MVSSLKTYPQRTFDHGPAYAPIDRWPRGDGMDADSRNQPLNAAELAAMFGDSHWATKYPPVIDLEQAAELLRLPKATLYDWSSRGRLKNCSFRAGEAKWLAWDDVSFEHNTVGIRAKDDWKPKNREGRLVPMSARLRQTLEGRRSQTKWVFTARPSPHYPAGDHQISERRALQYLKRVLKSLGLTGHLHTFRHSFVSRALTSGIPEATLQKWVGHLDPEVTQLYTHVLPPESQAAMQRLNAGGNAGEGREVA